MEVIEEVDATPKEALKLLKKFSQDPFLEENDPDLSKSINLVYQNLVSTSFEISTPPQVSETIDTNDEPAPVEKKHRHHHSHEDKEE